MYENKDIIVAALGENTNKSSIIHMSVSSSFCDSNMLGQVSW